MGVGAGGNQHGFNCLIFQQMLIVLNRSFDLPLFGNLNNINLISQGLGWLQVCD